MWQKFPTRHQKARKKTVYCATGGPRFVWDILGHQISRWSENRLRISNASALSRTREIVCFLHLNDDWPVNFITRCSRAYTIQKSSFRLLTRYCTPLLYSSRIDAFVWRVCQSGFTTFLSLLLQEQFGVILLLKRALVFWSLVIDKRSWHEDLHGSDRRNVIPYVHGRL
jgi:hypothetical protein